MNNLRWVSAFVRSQKWAFGFGFLLMMIETCSDLAGRGIQKWIIDDIFIQGRYERLPLYLLLLALFIITGPVLFTVVAMVHHHIGYNLRVVLAKKIMGHLYTIPIPILQKERTTRYTDYVTTDVYAVGENVSYKIPSAIQQIVMSLLLMGCIGYFSPVLLISVTVFSCSYIALGRYSAGRVRTLSREVQDHKTDLLVHIEEGISSTREVVAYHRAEWEMKIYDTLFKRYYESVMTEGRLANKNMLLSDPLKWFSNLMVLFFGGYLVIQGRITAGAFVVIYQYASQLVGSFQEVFSHYLRFNQTLANIDRLKRVTEIESIQDGKNRLHSPIQSLVFNQVGFKYTENENRPVLNQLSLSIPIGRKVAFVGTSGSGKSTIARLLIRYYEPTFGQILVNGAPLSGINRGDWHQRVAITFQEPYLFPDTVRNNIVFGRNNVPDAQVQRICRDMLLEDVINNMPEGYETEVGERGIMLSGGQRQRLALARAVLCDPEILILDEATSALDLETERSIQRNLDELRKGRTTIIIAHRLSTIQNADVIYVVDEGKIVESGTHDELIQSNSYYSKLIFSQTDESSVSINNR